MIALGIVGVLLIYAYSQGLFSKDRGRVVNPTTPGTVTDNSVPTLQASQYTNKATNIHTSLTQYFQGLWGDMYTILADLQAMPDADLIQTANEYARLYHNEDAPTLYAAINGVSTWYGSSTYTLKYDVLERLKKLGL